MKTTKKAVKKAATARKKKAAKKVRQGLSLPATDFFYAPVLRALQEKGGAAQKREVISHIVKETKYPEAQLEILDSAGRPVIENRIQWARAVLVRTGYVVGSRAGTWGRWELTNKGRRVNLKAISAYDFADQVDQAWSKIRLELPAQAGGAQPPGDGDDDAPPEEEIKLGDELIRRLLSLTPTAFEHFCNRVLTDVGFNVQVTRQTRDGGIDGEGTLEVNPFIKTSFVFQCKRYTDKSVGPDMVNQLEGIIAGGAAQKGAIITTSRFTRDARKRAQQGNSPIELIDGDQLVQLMVKHRVGVQEAWTVDEEFFSGFEKDEKPAEKSSKKRGSKRRAVTRRKK